MLPFILGGVAVYGAYKLYKLSEEEEARKLQAEERLWNDGKCPQCGRKWHLRWFFPPGSRGEYQDAAISCRHCMTRAELHLFKPPVSEWKDLSVK